MSNLWLPLMAILALTAQDAVAFEVIDIPGAGVSINCTDPELCELLTNHVNNQLLEEHSHYFENATGTFGRVYSIGVDNYTLSATPSDLKYEIYSAVGYGAATTILVKPKNGQGFILIDSGTNEAEVSSVIQAFTDKGIISPHSGSGRLHLRGIIYTHNHLDHTGGAATWLAQSHRPRCPAQNDGEDGTYFARINCVEIISHVKTTDQVINTATRVGVPLDSRSNYMVGGFSIGGAINIGVGPAKGGGPGAAYEPPSKTVTNFLDLRILGLRLHVRSTPSETDDQMVVFMPDSENSLSSPPTNPKNLAGVLEKSTMPSPQNLGSGALFAGEAAQGPPAFPNLYSLRGTSFRSPLRWYESVDVMRLFDAWCLVPNHGVPIMQAENVQLFLTNFRDAVQFVHDQTLRYIRQGYIPDELVTLVSEIPYELISSLDGLADGLPSTAETLPVDPRDHLRSMYGTVPQSVRGIYFGYIGWNQGDPTYFKPLAPTKRANKYLEMFGGACEVLASAQTAYDTGLGSKEGNNEWKEEIQWAAELLSYVLSASNVCPCQVRAAQILKAKAFLQLGASDETDVSLLESDLYSLDPNWRNWFVMGAQELALAVDGEKYPFLAGLSSTKCQQGVPTRSWVQHWGWRFNPATSANVADTKFGFEFVADDMYWDETKRYVLHVAGKVLRLIDDVNTIDGMWPDDLTLGVQITRDAFVGLLEADNSTSGSFMKELKRMIVHGDIVALKGNAHTIGNFFSPSHFDPTPTFMPNIVGRPIVQKGFLSNEHCDCCEASLKKAKKKVKKSSIAAMENVASEKTMDDRPGIVAAIVGGCFVGVVCVICVVYGVYLAKKRSGYEKIQN